MFRSRFAGMAVKLKKRRPCRILFHNSYPGLHGSQKIALQLLEGLPQGEYEAWAGAPFETDFLSANALPESRRIDFHLPEAFRSFRGELMRRSPWLLFWQVLTLLLPFWWRAWQQLRRHEIDLVYASNERCLFFIGVPACLAGLPVLWHIQSGFRKGKPWMHRLASRLATRAVAVSKAVRDDARAFVRGAIWRRMEVIYNGLPDVVPSSLSQKTRNASPIKLIFVGALTPEKGLHVLLRALAELPEELRQNLTLNVVGAFQDEWYQVPTEEMAAALPVKFLGYRTDVPELLAASDALVVPSIEREVFRLPDDSLRTVLWKEGFNLAALEGMRAGIPVLAASSYGLREVVTEGKTGLLFEPGDSADLRKKILQLVGDETYRIQLGQQGRQRFLQYFSMEQMCGQFHRVFQNMSLGRG